MFLNELVNQANQIRQARTRAVRRTRARSMVIGAGVGATIGIAVGILFAPRSGKETRQIIAERAGETVKELEENAAAAKARISTVVTEKGARLREAGQKVIKTAKKSGQEKADFNATHTAMLTSQRMDRNRAGYVNLIWQPWAPFRLITQLDVIRSHYIAPVQEHKAEVVTVGAMLVF